MRRLYLYLIVFLLTLNLAYATEVVNVYVFGGEIPNEIIKKFTDKTGIHVHFSTYDSNETLYAKLRATKQHNNYDVILPSGYYVDRLKKQNLLEPLNKNLLPKLHNLDPMFQNPDYDHYNHYSVPFIWGATGLVYLHKQKALHSWADLWHTQARSLMLLDDPREVFAMALIHLGYSPNDTNPQHIQEAYTALLTLIPAIKLFASDGIQAMLIDEDVQQGMIWNGDALKAQMENKSVRFAYPKEGFVLWVDCLAIPKNPPHLKAAYQFINFLLTPEIAAEVARFEGHAITNANGRRLLPPEIRDNQLIYPHAQTLKRGYFQRDITESALQLYNNYWLALKLAF